MRIIYKIQLKIHKQKFKTINSQTVANKNRNLNPNKRVHPNKTNNNKISKSKTLMTTCRSFKNRHKGMID